MTLSSSRRLKNGKTIILSDIINYSLRNHRQMNNTDATSLVKNQHAQLNQTDVNSPNHAEDETYVQIAHLQREMEENKTLLDI